MLAAHGLIYTPPTGAPPPWPPLRFDTRDARFVLLSGPSGCGKSTLLRVLCGLLPGFRGGTLAGQASILGKPVLDRPDGRVGMLFQNADAMLHSPRVADELLARAQTAGNAARGHGPANLRRGWLSEVIETFELGRLLDRRIVEISGGEQQRVALAAVLATRPEVVLLDEPTSNLDPLAATALVKLMALCGERFATRFVAAEHRADHLRNRIDGAIRLEARNPRAPGANGPEKNAGGTDLKAATSQAEPSDGCIHWCGPTGTVPPQALPEWLDFSVIRTSADANRPASPDRPILACRNVSCHRAGRQVLDRIDFGLQAGEIVGLTGPNGAGKSSLLLLLAGGLKASSGSEIRWSADTSAKPLLPRVGLLLQNPMHQLFCETVREEVALAARNAGVPMPKERMEHLLTAADLVAFADRPTLSLSYGEQQRTALAAAMSAQPPVVLLDEPTHGMDAVRLGKIIRFLLDARRGGTTFVVASHDRELLGAFCDRVLSLQDGRVLPTQPNHG